MLGVKMLKFEKIRGIPQANQGVLNSTPGEQQQNYNLHKLNWTW